MPNPYAQFRFRVTCNGTEVAGVNKVSGLHEHGSLRLEAGITQDAAFAQWANTPEHPRDLTIEMFDEAGQKVHSYTVYRCWVSEWQALPDVGAPGTALAIQSLTLQHDGWVRHDSTALPTEANFG